jgi:hypothetical protein
MTAVRWTAALLGMVLIAAESPAQGVIISSPGPYYGYPVGGAFISFGRGHVRGYVAFPLGGYYGSYGPYAPYGPYGITSNQVTVVVNPTPQVVVVQPDPDELLLERLRASLRDDEARADRPLQGEQHFGGFHRVDPHGNPLAPEPLKPPAAAPPAAPPPQAPPAQPPAPKPPAPMPPIPPPAEPPDLPKPPAPLNDPNAEYNRLLGLGRAAFANLEYGRAAERFRQAAALQPNQTLPIFLLAETLFAQGKYRDAVDAINAGMILQPDWPNARFQPLELYGPHAADYADQLHALLDALDRQPGDPDLLFLAAYVLWFDGRKDDARRLFQKALPGAADPAMVQRFLRAAAGPAAL